LNVLNFSTFKDEGEPCKQLQITAAAKDKLDGEKWSVADAPLAETKLKSSRSMLQHWWLTWVSEKNEPWNHAE